MPSPKPSPRSESAAATQISWAYHCLLHVEPRPAPLAIALVALLLLTGCTARFGFMEPVVVERPVVLLPRVVERVKTQELEQVYPK